MCSGASRPVPQFVIEREIEDPASFTEADIREASLKSLEVLRQLGSEIQWIQSFVTNDKIYCIYYAPDEAMILEHGKRSNLRVDRVAAVRRLVDPSTFA
jgi:uncharacterized protein DUF4242